MVDLATSHNLLIDSHNTLEEEVRRLVTEVLDLEERSRRNNIRIRRFPESIAPDQLNVFLTDQLALTLLHCSIQDLTINKIHRIPKPQHLPSQIPRNMIARIHFFQVKEEFLKTLSLQEVQKVIRSSKLIKSPCPDGLPNEYYQTLTRKRK